MQTPWHACEKVTFVPSVHYHMQLLEQSIEQKQKIFCTHVT